MEEDKTGEVGEVQPIPHGRDQNFVLVKVGEGIGGLSAGELIFFRKSDTGGQEARGDGLDLGGQFDKIKDGLKIKDVWVK